MQNKALKKRELIYLIIKTLPHGNLFVIDDEDYKPKETVPMTFKSLLLNTKISKIYILF